MVAAIFLVSVKLLMLGIHIGKHGQKRKKEYHAGWAFIAVCISFVLYYFAGVFNNF